MKSFTIRLMLELLEALQRLARRQHRSVNAEIIVALEAWIKSHDASS
ncbi:MAG: Arc family DNA-binding protein [Dehalococcoidia bacterium]|nr:Arc family DNA-binding protein [Dehalococcoidia bacterium]